MKTRVVLVVIAVAVLAAAWATLTYLGSNPPPPPAATTAPAPPAVPRAPAKPTPSPAAEPEAPRRARRAPEPKTAPAPSPAAPAADAPADVATLRIDSDVPGAQVFLDREFVGQAPVTVRDVKPGSHRINVSSPGYEGVAETVDLVPGARDIVIRLKDVRLDATLAVVHKHRFGSCRGQLTATPQGIRYQTTDKEDGFSAALADLEVFEVDYLKKNLRMKLRKGRQFDFTDPDGNADRLFVFHRDVSKAAEKLKSR